MTPAMSNQTESGMCRSDSHTHENRLMLSQPSQSGLSALRAWHVGDEVWELGQTPLLMGIVNVTPDSFSDGGEYFDVGLAIEQSIRLVDEGANIIDVGGESTRPNATPVPLEEELRRVVPVVRELARQTKTPISIDTYKAEVARQCLANGAVIVNDISGLAFDSDMPRVCRDSNCGVIAMHIQGTPQTMQLAPRYVDVVTEVGDYFSKRLEALEAYGIARSRIVLDPGIGFGKSAEHNIELLSHISDLRSLGRPVLIGHSRKRFLKKILGREIEERNSGTIGVSLALAAQGTDILRVHDVRATRDAILAWKTVLFKERPGSVFVE